MRTFYILHYSDDNGRESIVITEEEVTPELIEDHKPFKHIFNRAIECSTMSNDIDSLPLDSEMKKHTL